MERFKFTEALVTQPATMLKVLQKEGQKENLCKADAKKHNDALKKGETSPLTPKRSAMGPIFSGLNPLLHI